MRNDEPLMAGHLPAQDRHARALLDAGRFVEADIAFDEMTIAAPNYVDDQWNRSTVLVHRALLAWRLGRIPLALELAAEGWIELDVEQPRGESAAQTISMLGYLLETIGHRASALELMGLSVHVARETGDPATIAHCLVREGNALLFRAVARSDGPTGERFSISSGLYEEAVTLAAPGLVHRAALAGSARALLGIGEVEKAQQRADEVLDVGPAVEDAFSVSLANWVLAEISGQRGQLEQARTFASRALDGAEKVHDNLLMMRFSLDLAQICEQLGDPFGEAAALKRSVRASRAAVETLQEGLGQALEQRRVAVQAQRLAMAAQEAAVRDPLTGLINRLGLERRAPALLHHTAAQGRVPWLVMVDVDWFKDVNDDAGHAAGDAALQEVAHLLRRECRADDLLCRWAGDEFVVLLVDASEESRNAGPVVAERIRLAVDTHDWRLVVGHTKHPPTVSIGVAAGPAQLDQLFAAADIALYRAKRSGRNRVEIERSEPDTDHPRIR